MRVRTRRLTVRLAVSLAAASLAIATPSAISLVPAVAATTPSTAAAQPAVRTAEAPVLDRTITDDRITESSGLARSTFSRRLLWTHNDSGDEPRLFAVGRRGSTRAVISLRGAQAVDWEDVASGPRHTLWVADIGDNDAGREVVSVYRLREPKALEDGAVRSTRFDLTYPGGPRNAEGLMVNPRSGRVFVVSKDSDGGAIYRAPKELRADRVNRLSRVGSAPATITGASIAPGGRSFALCSYASVYVYRALGSSPRRIGKPDTEQGESIEVARRGGAFLIGSEGANSPVYRVPAP